MGIKFTGTYKPKVSLFDPVWIECNGKTDCTVVYLDHDEQRNVNGLIISLP